MVTAMPTALQAVSIWMVVQDAAVTDRVHQLSDRLIGGGDEYGSVGHFKMSVSGESLHFLIGGGAIDIKQVDDSAELMKTPELDFPAFDDAGESGVERKSRIGKTTECVAVL
jgi:hypothetical protein